MQPQITWGLILMKRTGPSIANLDAHMLASNTSISSLDKCHEGTIFSVAPLSPSRMGDGWYLGVSALGSAPPSPSHNEVNPPPEALQPEQITLVKKSETSFSAPNLLMLHPHTRKKDTAKTLTIRKSLLDAAQAMQKKQEEQEDQEDQKQVSTATKTSDKTKKTVHFAAEAEMPKANSKLELRFNALFPQLPGSPLVSPVTSPNSSNEDIPRLARRNARLKNKKL